MSLNLSDLNSLSTLQSHVENALEDVEAGKTIQVYERLLEMSKILRFAEFAESLKEGGTPVKRTRRSKEQIEADEAVAKAAKANGGK